MCKDGTLDSMTCNKVTLGIQNAVPASPRRKILPPEPDDLPCSSGLARHVRQGPHSDTSDTGFFTCAGTVTRLPRPNHLQRQYSDSISQTARNMHLLGGQVLGVEQRVFQPWLQTAVHETGARPSEVGPVLLRSTVQLWGGEPEKPGASLLGARLGVGSRAQRRP